MHGLIFETSVWLLAGSTRLFSVHIMYICEFPLRSKLIIWYTYDQPIQQIYHNPCGNSHFGYQLTTESAYYLVHTLNQLHFLGLPMTTPPRNPIFIVYHFAHYRIALATTYSSARYSLTDVRPIALLATVQYTKSILRRNSKSYPLSRITELNLTRRGRDEGSTNYSASDPCYHSLSTLSPFQKWGV